MNMTLLPLSSIVPGADNLEVAFAIGNELSINQPDRARHLVAHCFPPRYHSPYLPSIWAFLMHGATYDWHYWHLPVEGAPPEHYSVAGYLADHGIGVVAIDHPGCGQSRWDGSGEELTLETIALANAQAVRQLRTRLAAGTLVPGLPPQANARIVGIGHSMGGAIGTTMQALTTCFDAWVAMGWTNQPLAFGLDEPAFSAAFQQAKQGILPISAARQARRAARLFFYLEDVPDSLITADEAWVSTLPVGPLSEILAGHTARYAAALRVPVLLVFGERDLTTNPYQEPEYYPQASRCDLILQQGAAHCHHVASRHQVLKLLLVRWLWQVFPERQEQNRKEKEPLREQAL